MALFHSGGKLTPAILFIVLVIAILLFICGLVLFLVKLLKKQRFSSIFQSNTHLDFSSSSAFQRQLQHLFHSHDSGLDQSLIDALPMFIYKDIMGVSGPFDCPVCLCEFSEEEKLRLLPLCKHAFHLKCIDTWLQSNSTCPLCRGTLFNPGSLHQSPDSELDDSRNAEGFSVNVGDVLPSVTKPAEPENNVTEKKVFSVRLGKFRHTNESGRHEDIELGETSNINLDSRRCFSMGSVQYVVADTEFQVALCANRGKGNNQGLKVLKGKGDCNQNTSNDGKKITKKRESFSISKTWLWPKKSKIPNDRENHFSKSINISPPDKLESSMREVSSIDSVALADQVCSRDEYVCDSSRQLNSDPEEKSDAV